MTLTRQDWRPDEDITQRAGPAPGFSRSLEAHWEVHVERDARFDVLVRFEPGRFGLGESPLVELSVGDRVWTTPRVFGCDVYRLRDIALEAGDADVRAAGPDAALNVEIAQNPSAHQGA